MQDKNQIDQAISPSSDSSPENAIEQREVLLAYWKKQLAHAPSLLELPTDYPRPAVQTYSDARIGFTLGTELGGAMRKLGTSSKVDLHTILLSAFYVLLSRYSGQTDICVGCPFDNPEGGPDTSPNPLVLRMDLSDDFGFQDLITKAHSVSASAQTHRRMPFSSLVEALVPNRSLSHAPLIQVCFSLDSTAVPSQASDELAQLTQADLTLRFADDETLTGEIHYNGELFKATTMGRLPGHLTTLLGGALSSPDKPVSQLPLLTEPEQQQIIVDWNATGAASPDACVHSLFEQQVALSPDATAVVFGDQSLSYAELNAKSNQLANYLRANGVGPDVLVGVCVKRSMDMVVALLGILKAGGAYVPLDPAYPRDRLTYMFKDANPILVLSQESLLGQLEFEGVNIFCLDRDWNSLSHHDKQDLSPNALPQTLAYVIYTSGSTGKPKGVALNHLGLCNLCVTQAAAFEVDRSSQVLQFASISFDAAVSETFVTLTQGACLHLIKQEALRSAYEITTLLEKSAISIVTLPPSLLAVLPKKELPALKTLVLAGEAWSPELAKDWGQNRRMLNAYGPTEGTVCATWFKVDASVTHIVPIGKPLPNVTIYILDRHLSPTPVGVPGELYIGGIGLARGYLHRPDLTAERFIPNCFSNEPGSRLYRTGDKARYLEDGNIEFLGRIDHQVKLRGYRIELGEIEAALTAHESVSDAAVIVREDHPGEKRLVAYVVGVPGLNGKALKVHLQKSLPDYMLPQVFVFLENMPISANGKLDRNALPQPGTARASDATNTSFARQAIKNQ